MAKPAERLSLQLPPPAAPPIDNKQTPLPTSETSSIFLKEKMVSCWKATPKPLLYLVSLALMIGGIYLLCHLAPFAIAIGLTAAKGKLLGIEIGIVSIGLGIFLAYCTHRRSPPYKPRKRIYQLPEDRKLPRPLQKADVNNAIVAMLLEEDGSQVNWEQFKQNTCEDTMQALRNEGFNPEEAELTPDTEAFKNFIEKNNSPIIVTLHDDKDGDYLVIVNSIRVDTTMQRYNVVYHTPDSERIETAEMTFLKKFKGGRVIIPKPNKRKDFSFLTRGGRQ